MKEYREDNGTYLEGHHPSYKGSMRSPSGVASGGGQGSGCGVKESGSFGGGTMIGSVP
jgi:hypothetical protein